jgi:hypothetical protein
MTRGSQPKGNVQNGDFFAEQFCTLETLEQSPVNQFPDGRNPYATVTSVTQIDALLNAPNVAASKSLTPASTRTGEMT